LRLAVIGKMSGRAASQQGGRLTAFVISINLEL
jgi:hypothetical protein